IGSTRQTAQGLRGRLGALARRTDATTGYASVSPDVHGVLLILSRTWGERGRGSQRPVKEGDVSAEQGDGHRDVVRVPFGVQRALDVFFVGRRKGPILRVKKPRLKPAAGAREVEPHLGDSRVRAGPRGGNRRGPRGGRGAPDHTERKSEDKD